MTATRTLPRWERGLRGTVTQQHTPLWLPRCHRGRCTQCISTGASTLGSDGRLKFFGVQNLNIVSSVWELYGFSKYFSLVGYVLLLGWFLSLLGPVRCFVCACSPRHSPRRVCLTWNDISVKRWVLLVLILYFVFCGLCLFKAFFFFCVNFLFCSVFLWCPVIFE